MPRDNAIAIDDEIIFLARRFRKEAVASLVTVLRDPHALASAKAQASATLLAYSDGKPTQARQITVADVSSMGAELRAQLWLALFTWYETDMPGRIKATMRAAVDDALAQAGLTLPAPSKYGFKRGPYAGCGDEVPRWPARRIATQAPGQEPPAAPIRASPSAESASPDGCPPENAPDAARPVFEGDHVVVQLPGTRRAGRPPAVSAIRPYQDDPTPAHGGNGIHPSVVERSALKNPLDHWRRR